MVGLDVQGATAAMAGLRMQSNGGANALAASSPLMFNSSVAAANQARSNPGGAQNQPWMSQAATAQQRAELANVGFCGFESFQFIWWPNYARSHARI